MNNMKKMKGVSLGSSAYGVVDQEEVRTRFKHQSLLQDFGELEKETELMKKRLQKTKRKKLTLLAEVRFLRRRYEFLIKNPPQETSLEPLIPFQNPVVHREVAAKERIYTEKDFIVSRPYKHLDLNASLLGGEEEAGMLKLDREPLRVDKKLKRCSTTKVAAPASNVNFSISRDVGNGSDRSAKRRVSWQDPVALRGNQPSSSNQGSDYHQDHG
ncbi:hypothetical protein AAC387_Pa03g0312 [Persea americana]